MLDLGSLWIQIQVPEMEPGSVAVPRATRDARLTPDLPAA